MRYFLIEEKVPVRISRLDQELGIGKLWFDKVIRQQFLWKVGSRGDGDTPEDWKNNSYSFVFYARNLGELI